MFYILKLYIKISCFISKESVSMKIIHVTQFLGIGGLEKILFHLIIEQQKQGHLVDLYVYDYDRKWVDYFKSNGINVILPPIKKPGIDLTMFKRFNHDLMKYDIIHSHDMNPMFYIAPLMAFRRIFYKKNPKYIHTTHGTHHIIRVPRYKYIEKYLSPLCDRIICVGQKIVDYYQDELGIAKNKLVLIENGVPTLNESVTPELKLEKRKAICSEHGIDISKFIIVCVSRVTELKDQNFLIETLKDTKEVELLIIGPPSDEKYYKILEDKVKNIPHIKLLGAKSNINDYNLAADLFVSASTHEGIPVAVLEAMACKTPCLVSDISGHSTLNKYKKAVFTYDLHNQEDFIKKLNDLKNQIQIDPQVSIVINNATDVVQNEYSVKKMVNDYLKEYAGDNDHA